MTAPRILIACIGNIFMGDDGFGCEVARRMAAHSFPEGVTLKDFGIRGLDLTYALLDPWDLVILVDACPRGGEPGQLYLIQPDPVDDSAAQGARLETHSMNPMSVLRAVKAMGGPPNRILLVGCEPADLGTLEEGRLGLSDAVEAAVNQAIHRIETLVSKTLGSQPMETVPQLH